MAVTGGGTGGHIVPALNICRELLRRKPDLEIIYFGSRGSLEEKLVRIEGYRFCRVLTAYLRRSLSPRNLVLPFIVIISLIQAIVKLRLHNTMFVIGTGGYSAFPALYAAKILKVTYVIHEQNAYPGLVTRLVANGARRIYLAYSDARKHMTVNPLNVMVTGNPVTTSPLFPSPVHRERDGGRMTFLDEAESRRIARDYFGLQRNRQTVFITGGSGGALSINRVVDSLRKKLVESGYNLIWQTGKNYSGPMMVEEEYRGWIVKKRFFNTSEMQTAYTASDIAVARCGAMTLAELAMMGLPAILIPYPHAAGGHQEANGKAVQDAGGAWLIPDRDLTPENLLSAINQSMDDEVLARMSKAMKGLAKPEATEKIVDDIMGIIEAESAS